MVSSVKGGLHQGLIILRHFQFSLQKMGSSMFSEQNSDLEVEGQIFCVKNQKSCGTTNMTAIQNILYDPVPFVHTFGFCCITWFWLDVCGEGVGGWRGCFFPFNNNILLP